MRKIDYQILADILAACLKAGKDARQQDTERFDGYICAVDAIAHQFATRASVKPAEFLRACGLLE